MYSVFLEKRAEKELKHLPPAIKTKTKILLKKLAKNPFSLQAKKLTGSKNYFRVRIGEYRLLYEIVPARKAIYVFRIRHRRESYRNL